MAYCVFKCKFPLKPPLSRSQPDGVRLRKIIDASISYGDSLHCDLQRRLDGDNSQVYYHRGCISKYLMHVPASSPADAIYLSPPVKRSRHSDVTDVTFKEHCIYCGDCCTREKDKKNRWIPAYLVTEVDTNELGHNDCPMKTKDRLIRRSNGARQSWISVYRPHATYLRPMRDITRTA